MNHFMC